MGPRIPSSSPLASPAEFRAQVEGLRPYLLRYASLQLRDAAAADLDAEGASDDIDAQFDRRGHWEGTPDAWEQPEGALCQKQFLAALEACLRALPERTARVFMMREHLGFETAEICKELGITPTHCWVMLHRARMALRLCLQTNWFGK